MFLAIKIAYNLIGCHSHKKFAEGTKADRVSQKNAPFPPPSLAQGPDPPLYTILHLHGFFCLESCTGQNGYAKREICHNY